MELISLSLGLSANRLNGFFEDQTSYMRLNHYPTCPIPHLALGIGRHKDSGALAILAQDDVEGLEVKRKTNGEWIRVKPIHDAHIINVGDIIQKDPSSHGWPESGKHFVLIHGACLGEWSW
ncbi:unnamed protein product [Ilex paraguariensis]|uniref:Fe2OG dioxygenase domain-containing protein n=1 Tax=Ilex paraguariensis TaxID=185542 RepID=A0ABC8V0Q6_9AQUA